MFFDERAGSAGRAGVAGFAGTAAFGVDSAGFAGAAALGDDSAGFAGSVAPAGSYLKIKLHLGHRTIAPAGIALGLAA
jgi:hypothetical protein